MTIRDAGDQPRGKSKRPGVRAPEPMSLFDISDQPPPTPFQVKSSTSIDAAKETRSEVIVKRRSDVFHAIRGSSVGLARFQIAERLKVPEHWVSSSCDALIKQRKIEESPTLTIVNPRSMKTCAVLVSLSDEMEGAA